LGGAAISSVGKPERVIQNRVIALFRDELGYRYIGEWSGRDNSNIEAVVPEQGYQASEVASCLGCHPSNVSRALQKRGYNI
jgi:type I restriction enzyme R subunit